MILVRCVDGFLRYYLHTLGSAFSGFFGHGVMGFFIMIPRETCVLNQVLLGWVDDGF